MGGEGASSEATTWSHPEHRRNEEAFDELAPAYDDEVGGTVGAAHAKARATRALHRHFGVGDVVLDVGCGTGVDACHLASRGVEVLALDVSERMLEITRERARERGVGDLVTTVHLPAARVGELVKDRGAGFLDGAYSFFGAFNLEPQLEDARRGLARALREGAPLLAGLVNPFVLWELTLYPLILRWDKPVRKARREETMRVSRARDDEVPVHLMTPTEFHARMTPGFELERTEGQNILVPPPYLDRYARKFPRFLSLMSRWEERIAGRPPWNRLGYFSLVTLRRDTS